MMHKGRPNASGAFQQYIAPYNIFHVSQYPWLRNNASCRHLLCPIDGLIPLCLMRLIGNPTPNQIQKTVNFAEMECISQSTTKS